MVLLEPLHGKLGTLVPRGGHFGNKLVQETGKMGRDSHGRKHHLRPYGFVDSPKTKTKPGIFRGLLQIDYSYAPNEVPELANLDFTLGTNFEQTVMDETLKSQSYLRLR